MITATEIYVANVGDSRAVLTQGLSVYDLSDDHKPDNEEEQQRIIKAGGNVDNGRVNGELALSRAVGDMYYKRNPKLTVSEQCITCVPEITVRKRQPEDSFLVVACDGIWDCLTSSEMSIRIQELLKEREVDEERQKIIEDIFDEIISPDANDPESDGTGTDNMTCIFIEFGEGSCT